MSATVRRWRRSVRSLVGSRTGSDREPVCAAASRSSSARATRSRMSSATARFDMSGSSSRLPSASRIVTRLVSVPNPEPASETSFATSRSTPLRRSLSAARSSEPVSAANPTRKGRGSAARRVTPPSRSSPRAIRATSARMSGVGFELEGRASRRVRASVSAGRRRPEVGDRRGHHERVEARPSSPSGVGERGAGGAHLAGGLDGHDRGVRPVAATSRFAATSVTRAPRSTAALATATPIFPVERLPMKRTGSIGSRVPPA